MSANGLDSSKGPGPPHSQSGGPRHRLTRSITESTSLPTAGRLLNLQAQAHPQRQNHNQPQHQHQPTRHHYQTRNDDRGPPPPSSSAHPPLHSARASLDLPPRPEGPSTTAWTPGHSRGASLRTSGGVDELRTTPNTMSSPQSHPAGLRGVVPRGTVTAGIRAERDRQAALLRITGLKMSLADLNTCATSTMQRFEDAQHSITERSRDLERTVAALRELADLSHNVPSAFEDVTGSFGDEVYRQLDDWGSFEPQQRRVEALQDRVEMCRARVRDLGGRIDGVKETVERWERRDSEWQEKTRRRLRAIWIVTIILVLLAAIALALGGQYYDDDPAEAAAGGQGSIASGPDTDAIGGPGSGSFAEKGLDIFDEL